MMRLRVLLACLLIATACGGGGGREAAEEPSASCPTMGDEPVEIGVQWTGWWGNGSMRALFSSWEEAGVELDIRDAGAFLSVGVAMLDSDPPVVAQVSYAMVPTLVAAGAIQPIGDCLAESGVDFDGMVPGAATLADVDGVRYGAPASIDTLLLLYDREAFRRAGLDPDAPPATLDELHDVGVALRDRAGFETPVAWDGGHLALLTHDVSSDEARAAAEAWTRLGRDGLLYNRAEGETLAPIGSGRAAVELADPHGLWSYASAIADGQAPNADLAVAALPGLDGAIAPLSAGVWVVSADATPPQAAAATRFIAWLAEPAQQVRMHEMADLFPTAPSVIAEPDIQAHWDRLPLLRAAWELLTEDPTVMDGWIETIGVQDAIWRLLDVVARDGEPFDGTWDRIQELVARAQARATKSPDELLRCVHERIAEPEPPLAVCT